MLMCMYACMYADMDFSARMLVVSECVLIYMKAGECSKCVCMCVCVIHTTYINVRTHTCMHTYMYKSIHRTYMHSYTCIHLHTDKFMYA
jgi:hypothetical protein